MPSEPAAGFAPFEDAGDFVDLIGPVYARGEGDGSVLGLRVEERHRNAAGAAHGGCSPRSSTSRSDAPSMPGARATALR
jgi:acyl-coenzyme A thioesterase PaaI-like protein